MGVDAARAQEQTAREESVILVVSQYLGSQRAAADVQAAQSRVDLAQALYDQAADLQKNGVGTGHRYPARQRRAAERKAAPDCGPAPSSIPLCSVWPACSISILSATWNWPTRWPSSILPKSPSIRPWSAPTPPAPNCASFWCRSSAPGWTRSPRPTSGSPSSRLAVAGSQQGLTPNSVIPVYQYQGSLDFPIFTGGRIQAERAKADLAIRQLQQQEQELRNRIALEVKTAGAQLEAARSEVTVANLGVQLARQEVDQARDRFQAGVANNIEVVSAQDALSRANDNQIAALYRYNQSRADLAHAAGQMESLYAR